MRNYRHNPVKHPETRYSDAPNSTLTSTNTASTTKDAHLDTLYQNERPNGGGGGNERKRA